MVKTVSVGHGSDFRQQNHDPMSRIAVLEATAGLTQAPLSVGSPSDDVVLPVERIAQLERELSQVQADVASIKAERGRPRGSFSDPVEGSAGSSSDHLLAVQRGVRVWEPSRNFRNRLDHVEAQMEALHGGPTLDD